MVLFPLFFPFFELPSEQFHVAEIRIWELLWPRRRIKKSSFWTGQMDPNSFRGSRAPFSYIFQKNSFCQIAQTSFCEPIFYARCLPFFRGMGFSSVFCGETRFAKSSKLLPRNSHIAQDACRFLGSGRLLLYLVEKIVSPIQGRNAPTGLNSFSESREIC